MLMTLTRDAADAGEPECGEWGPPSGELGPGPVIWVNTSQLLGPAASPQPARLRELRAQQKRELSLSLPRPHHKESRMWETL